MEGVGGYRHSFGLWCLLEITVGLQLKVLSSSDSDLLKLVYTGSRCSFFQRKTANNFAVVGLETDCRELHCGAGTLKEGSGLFRVRRLVCVCVEERGPTFDKGERSCR